MEQLEEHSDVAIEWHSFELHPAGAPPISPERQARIMAGRPLLQKRAREQYGLEMNPGPFDTDSRPALVLEKYAQTQGKGAAFHVATMRAYWEQGKDNYRRPGGPASSCRGGRPQYEGFRADPGKRGIQ